MNSTKLLLQLGAPMHLKGFKDAELAIDYCAKCVHKPSITEEVYPYVASANNSTPSRVGKNIRYLVSRVWMNSDISVLESFFGNSVNVHAGVPTNYQFLITMAYYKNNQEEI